MEDIDLCNENFSLECRPQNKLEELPLLIVRNKVTCSRGIGMVLKIDLRGALTTSSLIIKKSDISKPMLASQHLLCHDYLIVASATRHVHYCIGLASGPRLRCRDCQVAHRLDSMPEW